MKKASYFFIILLTLFFIYFGVNGFKVHSFLDFVETKTTTGTVTKTLMVHVGRGRYKQSVHYTFTVNGSLFTDNFRAGRKEGKQSVGNKLEIRYSVSNPKKNDVIEFYAN